jgi:diguanylate cyclase (GGDEF)-like protein
MAKIWELWEFYENLNEVVYVTDMETDEVVYLNRAGRKVCGVETLEELKGKKCYEVLQGSAMPCTFCNNGRLKPGKFEEWNYYNPSLNRNFAIKDTMVEVDGKRYRMELAIDLTRHENQNVGNKQTLDQQTLINEALRISLAFPSPYQSVESFLEYIGKAFACDRSYIFERKDNDYYDNTYEWCAAHAVPQKEYLQDMPPETVAVWMKYFENGSNVIIEDLEETKEKDPIMYEYLLPQDIHSLVVCPLFFDNRLIGFYGVDNPPREKMENISVLFQIMGHFITLLLRRCENFKQMEHMSFYDELTGFGNRHAMDAYLEMLSPEKSIGIVYCDVTGLKRVNDVMGHKAGDALLIRACECIKQTYGDFSRYRIGGDEFLVLCSGITEEELLEREQKLKENMEQHEVALAVGYAWRHDGRINIDKLLTEADQRMYADKRAYYEKMGIDRRTR